MAAERCIVCNAIASENYSGYLGCPECGFTTYCSAECWEIDIVPHSLICGTYREFRHSVRQPEDGKAGLWLPRESDPIIFEVTCETRPYGELAGGRTFPKVQRLLGLPRKHPLPSRTLLQWNEYRAYDLDHTLALYQALPERRRKLNRCVKKLTKGTAFSKYWGGPLVILSMATVRYALDDPQYRDITLQDFRFLVDYFRYGDEPGPLQVPSPHNELAISNRVLGVRITCEVERQYTGSPEKYVSVRIPRDHHIFSTTATQISRTIGLPLLMTQSIPRFIRELKPEIALEGSLWLNHEAAFLQRITDLDDNDWGLVRKKWRRPERIGSVLVARADGRDIRPRQVAMIVGFCQALESYILEARRRDKEYKERVMTDLMTMEKFHLVFNMKKEELVKKDPVWKSVKSPYFD